MERQVKLGLDLTERETQILQLVALGNSAKEVAQEIQISPRTVECHIDTIRLKMRARNRTHMVALALALKLIAGPSLRDGAPALESGTSLHPGLDKDLCTARLVSLRKRFPSFGGGYTRTSAA